MRTLILLALFSATVACTPVPKGEPVPIAKLFAANGSKPYECAEYSAKTDTCEALAVRKVRGNRLDYRAEFIMPRLPGVPGTGRVTIEMPFQIEGMRYCGNFRRSNVKITGLPSSYSTDLAIAPKVELAREGDICTSYYRDGSGYLSVTTKRDGSPIRDGIGKVHFLQNPKPLRRVSLF